MFRTPVRALQEHRWEQFFLTKIKETESTKTKEQKRAYSDSFFRITFYTILKTKGGEKKLYVSINISDVVEADRTCLRTYLHIMWAFSVFHHPSSARSAKGLYSVEFSWEWYGENRRRRTREEKDMMVRK